MSRAPTLLLALSLSVTACSTSPELSSVDPAHGDCSSNIAFRIRGSALGPEVRMDLHGGTVGRLVVGVGGVGLSNVAVTAGAVVEGTLAGGALDPGADYDVLVRTASGAEAVLEGAFHCDGDPPIDGGDGDDAGDGDEDVDDADAEAEAEAGPLGTVVTLSEAGSARTGAAATVAWVADRWVVAWVDDDGGNGLLRLGEIFPGETTVASVHDITDAGRPTDPLIRSWAGLAWLSWVDKTDTPNRYRFRLLDDGLGVRAAGGPLGSADADVFWRRDHDVARDPGTGRFAFFAPILGVLSVSTVEADGTIVVRNAPLGTMLAPPAEPRAVWSAGAFRVAWWENPGTGGTARGAIVGPDAAVSAGPLDLPLDGEVQGPALWVDGRSGADRLFVCHETIGGPLDRTLHLRPMATDFSSPGSDLPLFGTGRGGRCTVRDGLVVWAMLSSLPTFSMARLAPDGSTAELGRFLGHAVRALPGVDVAVSPDRHGLVWLEDRAPGEPLAVRFAEVPPEP